MITGDNPLTAIHVAKDVEIVDRDVMVLDIREGSGKCFFHKYGNTPILK
jgi:magnesium-transporting ATPase (P-type)